MYRPPVKNAYPTANDIDYSINTIPKPGAFQSLWNNFKLGLKLDTTPGAFVAWALDQDAATDGSKTNKVLTKQEWENGPYYREGLSFDEDMSLFEAELKANDTDTRRYQEYLNSRSKGVGNGVIKFSGRIMAQAIDPINYIPFLGIGSKAFSISSKALVPKLLSAGVLKGAAEVGIATTLLQPFISYSAERTGSARTFQDVATDIAFGAAFGAVIGGVGSAVNKRINKGRKKKIEEALRDTVTQGDNENVFNRMSQEAQINNTKAFAKSVGDVIDGESAALGESALRGVKDTGHIYHMENEPVVYGGNEIGNAPDSAGGAPEAKATLNTKYMDETDTIELKNIDDGIEAVGKEKDVMTQAAKCLMGLI